MILLAKKRNSPNHRIFPPQPSRGKTSLVRVGLPAEDESGLYSCLFLQRVEHILALYSGVRQGRVETIMPGRLLIGCPRLFCLSLSSCYRIRSLELGKEHQCARVDTLSLLLPLLLHHQSDAVRDRRIRRTVDAGAPEKLHGIAIVRGAIPSPAFVTFLGGAPSSRKVVGGLGEM